MREMVGGCCVCSDERGWDENPLVYCDGLGCTVAVHQACYGIVSVPTGPWFCRKCEWSPSRVRCELCPSRDGALKRTDSSNAWAHVVCALYIPEVRFGNVSTMEPIVLGLVPSDRYAKTCYLCEKQGRGEAKAASGACMQCNRAGCKQSFHVTCAQSQGLLCEEAGNYLDNVKYCGYCEYHYSKINKKVIKTIPAYKPVSCASPESNAEPSKKNKKSRMDESSLKVESLEDKSNEPKDPEETEQTIIKTELSENNIKVEDETKKEIETPCTINIIKAKVSDEQTHEESNTNDDSESSQNGNVIKRGRPPKKGTHLPSNSLSTLIIAAEDRSPLSSPELESASSFKKKRQRMMNGEEPSKKDTTWMMGTFINPSSNVAKEMNAVLQNEIVSHSNYDASNRGLIGLSLPGKKSSSSTTQPQTLEELLERQWEQGSQFIMEQAASHFDIASLLSSLNQLKDENSELESSVEKLVQRRDHLLAVRARLMATHGYIGPNRVENGTENFRTRPHILPPTTVHPHVRYNAAAYYLHRNHSNNKR